MDPNINQPDRDDELAGDLLVGKAAIRDYLKFLGMPDDTDVYWLRRKRQDTGEGWPIGSDGGRLFASKRRLARHAQKITVAHQKSDASQKNDASPKITAPTTS
jgi:hypothetical protein